MGQLLLVVLGLVALLAAIASASGDRVGPAVFATGFLGLGGLMVVTGGPSLWLAFALGFLIVGTIDLMAVSESQGSRGRTGGPSSAWRWRRPREGPWLDADATTSAHRSGNGVDALARGH
jgi:hypothetical protein